MRKTLLRLSLGTLLATNVVVFSEPLPGSDGFVFAAEQPKVEKQLETQKANGKITNISQKAKTIALTQNDNSYFLVKFTDATKLKGVQSTKEFQVDEAIVVNYTTINGENVATSLEKALVTLPPGIKEIKTKELADLQNSNKDLVIVDSRPEVKYAESHIPGSISIPYSKLLKMGDEGAKLLEKYKDRQLAFYCGGGT